MRAGLTMAAAAQPCSSSTLWRSALTWPRRSASPEPGVRRGALRRVLAAVEAGVVSVAWRAPAASPTMGESLVMSCRAARGWVSPAAAFLAREKRAAESGPAAALFSAENRRWASSGNTSNNASRLQKRSKDQETESQGGRRGLTGRCGGERAGDPPGRQRRLHR
uniref:Uncharacterized protein n=1 Tax=Zea mays TaxID=4577 RepID=A0A804PBU8_MAIZE